jgi:hypothetical protein
MDHCNRSAVAKFQKRGRNGSPVPLGILVYHRLSVPGVLQHPLMWHLEQANRQDNLKRGTVGKILKRDLA